MLVSRVYNEQQKVRAESIQGAFQKKEDLISTEGWAIIFAGLILIFILLIVRARKK